MKQNNDKYLGLRERYPYFEFQSYSFRLINRRLEAEFIYTISGVYVFKPVIKIPARAFYHWEDLNDENLDNLVFHIGMIELISYWKTSCSPKVLIRPKSLDEEQIKWWKKLYFHGLGEFFYLNGIRAGMVDFMDIQSEGEKIIPIDVSLDKKKIIVPVGGGKDSVVSLEILKESGKEVIPMALNPRAAIKRTIASAGFNLDHSIVVDRKIDPLLLQLNDEGFLNGHTPFSALLAFINVLVAVGSGIRQIALSNESSASQSTIPGTKINHQYSKSFEFEEDFRWYVNKYIHSEIEYFSFLRPVNELQIAKLFAGYPQHFNGFRSCNAGSKIDEWCGDCPKCLFTEIILAPFLSDKQRFSIFRKDLLNEPHLEPVFDELTGKASIKPFECVGTPDEVNAALLKFADRIEQVNYPFLLKKFLAFNKNENREKEFDLLINFFNSSHFVPEDLLELLKEKAGLTDSSFKKYLEEEFSGQHKILILGFGKEGRSTYKIIQKYFPDIELGIADRNEKIQFGFSTDSKEKIQLFTGENYLDALKQFKLVIKSPGIKITDDDRDVDIQITSQTELFLKFYRDQVIGVTGTKGKSTTASLIHHLLSKAGKDTLLLGNIGVPAFDLSEKIKKDTIVVFELSAHQLQNLNVSPHVAVLLNIFPEHLDHFETLDEYAVAKLNIGKFQEKEDMLIIPEKLVGNPALKTNAGQIALSNDLADKILLDVDLSKVRLKGHHNIMNISAALTAVESVGIGRSLVLDSIYTFTPLPHRLEYVGNYGGIDFYNDSISTVPESTIEAVKTIPEISTLILGGFDRGLDYSKMVDFLKKSGITTFVFMGRAGEKMLQIFRDDANPNQNLVKAETLEDAFKSVLKYTPAGNVCLLSPAAASYDQFHNFEHRGDHFKMLAKSIKKGGNPRLV